jgi:hypothetical protein
MTSIYQARRDVLKADDDEKSNIFTGCAMRNVDLATRVERGQNDDNRCEHAFFLFCTANNVD